MANGKIVFSPAITLMDGEGNLYIIEEIPFTKNFGYGAEEIIREGFVRDQALDGTARAHKKFTKLAWVLPFKNVEDAQKELIESLYATGAKFQFTWDSDLPEAYLGYINRPPEFKQDLPNRWSGEMEVEQA